MGSKQIVRRDALGIAEATIDNFALWQIGAVTTRNWSAA